jgi:hypothetical protein
VPAAIGTLRHRYLLAAAVASVSAFAYYWLGLAP